MSEFKVIVENNGSIEFKNFFEFGQWNVIKKELKDLQKLLINVHSKNFGPKKIELDKLEADFNELAKEYNIAHRYKFTGSLTCVNDFLEEKLKSDLMYYFWAKCEWEVVIQGWPNNKVERKIDVYTQLLSNWKVFWHEVYKELNLVHNLV